MPDDKETMYSLPMPVIDIRTFDIGSIGNGYYVVVLADKERAALEEMVRRVVREELQAILAELKK